MVQRVQGEMRTQDDCDGDDANGEADGGGVNE